MKMHKWTLVFFLVVILLLGTVFAASAGDPVRLNGGMNHTFFGAGWEWLNVDASIDPGSHEAEGMVKYKVYLYDGNPKQWESWSGVPVCGALGEFEGKPTVALVVEIVKQDNIDPDWVGKFLKVTLTDGGQNGSEDILGIVAWDFVNGSPLDAQPSCIYQSPETGVYYYGDHGNITIHE